MEGLLALARAEGKRPEREVVDVGFEVQQRVEVWQALAEEQGVSLISALNGSARAYAVPGALPQILDNYLANALDVAPADTEISVSAERVGDAVEVRVRDAGGGLSDGDRARVFDRFWRAPGAAPGSGSGLGLAIVRQLAEASGGHARLDAAPGGGTDAVVVLPAAPVLTPR